MSQENRRGSWGCTFTGRRYWPEDPRPEDFAIEDIAHALSLQCRYAGHCRTFYSVAQHSVLVAAACDPADALWGLLHDASEAYVVDIPRPLKLSAGMEGYGAIESRFMTAICDAFGLPYSMPASVRAADEVLLATEARDLMPQHGDAGVPNWHLTHTPQSRVILPWDSATAEAEFIRTFHQLITARAA